MRKTLFVKFLVFALIILYAGCTTIPPETPDLSAELGNRIAAIESANMTLLDRYFSQKRIEIDKFIEEEWVPIFAEAVFSNPKIAQAWETVVREDNKKQRLMFLIKLGSKLQEKINSKRIELIQPLDELERHIEQKLRNEFSQARAINNSITSFLQSATKVTENRDRYLERLGITDEKIKKVIDKTDDAISGLLEKTKNLPEKIDSAKKFKDKLRSIRDSK